MANCRKQANKIGSPNRKKCPIMEFGGCGGSRKERLYTTIIAKALTETMEKGWAQRTMVKVWRDSNKLEFNFISQSRTATTKQHPTPAAPTTKPTKTRQTRATK